MRTRRWFVAKHASECFIYPTQTDDCEMKRHERRRSFLRRRSCSLFRFLWTDQKQHTGEQNHSGESGQWDLESRRNVDGGEHWYEARKNERLAVSAERMFEISRLADGHVRVGVKREGTNRGIWHGEWLVTREEVRLLAQALDTLRDVDLVSTDSLLPSVIVRVHSVEAVSSLSQSRVVDYVDMIVVPSSSFTNNSGCGIDQYQSAIHGSLVSVGNGTPALIHERVAELHVLRAWAYGMDGEGISIGWSDTGVDHTSGNWPAMTDLFSTSLIALSPNDGTDCSHGNRMIAVSSAPGRLTEFIGIAPSSTVVSSDHGAGVVIFNPMAAAPFVSLGQLMQTPALDYGPRVIALGWGTEWHMPSVNDLIDVMYYIEDMAIFAPAGSSFCTTCGVVFPARKLEVFAVTARTSVSAAHPGSHVGNEVDGIAFAPIALTGNTINHRIILDRSSAATAQVVGVAALVMQKYPSFSPAQLYTKLRSTAREFCGPESPGVTRIVNAEAAVGGLCVPQSQFSEVTYTFAMGYPSSFTHNYCLDFSGGLSPQFTVQHPTPHPSDPRCGSVTFGPDPDNPNKTLTIAGSIWDASVPANSPLSFSFRIRAVTISCPPSEPDCI